MNRLRWLRHRKRLAAGRELRRLMEICPAAYPTIPAAIHTEKQRLSKGSK